MTIKEVEKLAGIDRANIRFYEKEGLLEPLRKDNGYRDYSEDDLELLLRIKLLRSLNVPLEEIKNLKSKKKTLEEVLEAQNRRLEEEKKAAARSQEICHAIWEEHTTFANLDAQKYLDGFMEKPSSLEIIQEDVVPQANYPWRRFFARWLDLLIYQTLWQVLLAALFHVNSRKIGGDALGGTLELYAAIAIMVLVEPLLLHLFGTTIGKAVWGLRIELTEGRRLTYQEGLARTWNVLVRGMGFAVPGYNLVRLWKSYKLCMENEPQPWEDQENVSYTIKDTNWYRTASFIAVNLVLVCVIYFTLIFLLLPPNRGELRVGEFVENYKYYEKYLGVNSGSYEFDENGHWRKKPDEANGTFYLDLSAGIVPVYEYTCADDDSITGIQITEEGENIQDWSIWLMSQSPEFTTAALAYTGAQKEVHMLSARKDLDNIIQRIGNSGFSSYEFTCAGVHFLCQVSYDGFEAENYDSEGNVILIPKEGEANRFRRVLTMEHVGEKNSK